MVTNEKKQSMETVSEKTGNPAQKRSIKKDLRDGLVPGRGRQVQQGAYRLRMRTVQTGEAFSETVMGGRKEINRL